MVTRAGSFQGFITFCAIVWLCTPALGQDPTLSQNLATQFHTILREKASFDDADFAALAQGETVVKLLPVQDRREVAVRGLVRLQAPAEVFLQSFREGMARKNNPAILEIGSFSSPPRLEDLQTLTFEKHDVEDLKECVVGDCQLKLSAMMIERFQKEMDWSAPDYRMRAAHLLKLMLLDYVRDYLARGEEGLIEYNDKPQAVRLAEEQRALLAAPGFVKDIFAEFPQYLKRISTTELPVMENALVWSKINIGLKPVIAINHIMIYKVEQEAGPQILIVSKQIYANHYFDSSLGVTAFVNIPGPNPGSYLFYENRSRADGLGGPFGKIKRRIVENRAVDALNAVLEQSKLTLNARALNRPEFVPDVEPRWRQWTIGGVHLFLWLFLITAAVALWALRSYDWKGGFGGRARH